MSDNNQHPPMIGNNITVGTSSTSPIGTNPTAISPTAIFNNSTGASSNSAGQQVPAVTATTQQPAGLQSIPRQSFSAAEVSALIDHIRAPQPPQPVVPEIPNISKQGYRMQYMFNADIATRLEELAAQATDGPNKDKLLGVIHDLKVRNETIVVADRTPGVFEFLENRKEAEKLKTIDPALAEFVALKEKEDKKTERPPPRQPFRHRGAAWTPASRYSESQSRSNVGFGRNSGQQHRGQRYSGYIRGERRSSAGTCHSCGGSGHWKDECPKRRRF